VELTVLVPVGLVSQYHVTPGGGVPLNCSVTLAQFGVFDVGFPGFAGCGLETVAVTFGETGLEHMDDDPLDTAVMVIVVAPVREAVVKVPEPVPPVTVMVAVRLFTVEVL
jgi:hypothetical protein